MVAQDVHQETLEEPQEERQEALEAARCRRRMVCALERALHQATASIATIRALRRWLSRSSSIRTYQSLPLQATASSQSRQAISAHGPKASVRCGLISMLALSRDRARSGERPAHGPRPPVPRRAAFSNASKVTDTSGLEVYIGGP
jgi:hypothetical protein